MTSLDNELEIFDQTKWDMYLYAVRNMPLVMPGNDIGELIYEGAKSQGFIFEEGDIIVIAQKIVSKAEGAIVNLNDMVPSEEAQMLAKTTGRDPRLCEIYIRESSKIIGTKGRMIITKHRLGFICTCAGVDRSNVAPKEEEMVVLLPKDPDKSAARIRSKLKHLSQIDLAVIISDSFGKPDREGAIGVAIGIAGIQHLEFRKQTDLFGNPATPSLAMVDELAGAASTIMGQADENRPVVVIRGVKYTRDEAASLKRILIEGQ